MTLIERLRVHMKDYGAAVEAADRIEQLEAALRKIAEPTYDYYKIRRIARAALAPEQDK
jgi:hypothetical protein